MYVRVAFVVVHPRILIPLTVDGIADLAEGLPSADRIKDAAVAVDDVQHIAERLADPKLP